MTRIAVVGVLVCALAATSCGTSEPWAEQVDVVVASLESAYDAEDAYALARFFSAGGTLDLMIWERGIARTPAEVVEAVPQLWFSERGFANVSADHVFVSPDAAMIWWFAGADGGFQNWLQTYTFGAAGTASRAYRALEVPMDQVSETELAVLDFVDRYLEAWGSGDASAIGALYADDALVVDELNAREWRSRSQVVDDLASQPPLEAGPWPGVFVYEDGDVIEAISLVQTREDCPSLEARRWVFAQGTISHERRFVHVPSARRCERDLPSGWWVDYQLPPDLQENVTEVIDVGGARVDLVNAEPLHEEFSSYLFAKYAASGIGLPQVEAVWFPPAPECLSYSGLAIESDARYADRHTVIVCRTVDQLAGDSASTWSYTASTWGLHELAHIWMLDHLTDDIRTDFNQASGVDVWRSNDVPWRERGVELAATTIGWGVAGNDQAKWPLFPVPPCERLATWYELLTKSNPVTTCGIDGWSQ